MNLTTFAVQRKLAYDDPLLSYVTSGQDIPVSVVEASFSDYVSSIEQDSLSEGLVDDYVGTLAKEVPIVVQPDTNGGYEVRGDVPDTLVEAIKLLHRDVNEEEIVSRLVRHNLETVHGKACEVLTVSIDQAAEKTRMALTSLPEVVPVPEALTMEDLGLEDFEPELPMISEEPVPEESVPEESVPEESETVPEEPEADEEDARQQAFSSVIRSIYDSFLADLRARHLDTRLGLAI